MLNLGHYLAQHPHAGRIRKRRDRRLTAIRASKPVTISYAAALTHHVVEPLRAAGREAVERLRPHWPAVHDAPPPTIEHEVGRVMVRTTPETKGAAPRIAGRAVTGALANVDDKLSQRVQTSLGVEIRHVLLAQGPIDTAMNDALRENVDLITSISDDYFDELREVLDENWRNVGRWEDAVDAVEHLGDVTQSRAELIARDQQLKMNSRFNEVRQKSIGIKRYEWETAGDDRVREAHEELDGTIHDWDDPPTDSDGNTGHPGDCGVNDRCTASPILDLDESDEDDPEVDVDADEEEPEEPGDE